MRTTALLPTESLRLTTYLSPRYFHMAEPLTLEATPNNAYEILFTLSGTIAVSSARRAGVLPPASLLGMNCEATRYTFGAGTVGVHIQLAPQQLRRLVRTPLRELAQQPLALADVWGPTAADLPEQVLAAAGPLAKLEVVERFFAQRCRSTDTRASQQVAALVRADPSNFSVRRLREALDVSERQLERLFQEQVGASPQAYLKTSRFQHVMARYAQPGPARRPDLLPLALEAGYYDQSHFIRDCRHLTGRSPKAYFPSMDPVLSGLYNT